ncbi:MAG: hypothetical protein ACFFFH_03825 [Candidatus Thorarchaeota archaeon]
MKLTLEGRIITPIITKKTVFKLENCRAVIVQPKRRFVIKSHKERRIYPYSFIGYLGSIRLTYKCKTLQKAKSKLSDLLTIDSIGRFWSEGLGKIQWLCGKFSSKSIHQKKKFFGRVKIRKGLPHNLPKNIQDLLRYAMLHDFVHTTKHKSKIYVELDLEDLEYLKELKQHHESGQNSIIKTFQRYDRIAARMTRKVRSPRTNRYTWEAKEVINFDTLAQKIKNIENNIWRLYRYIYESKELAQLNESLNHGHSSLQYHLLLITNLIVQDHLRGFL